MNKTRDQEEGDGPGGEVMFQGKRVRSGERRGGPKKDHDRLVVQQHPLNCRE